MNVCMYVCMYVQCIYVIGQLSLSFLPSSRLESVASYSVACFYLGSFFMMAGQYLLTPCTVCMYVCICVALSFVLFVCVYG